jgi:hypothetical protein
MADCQLPIALAVITVVADFGLSACDPAIPRTVRGRKKKSA